jgi:DNA-binding response OmpR family regulator
MEQRPAQILLVDDEEPIRLMLGAMLRRRGYDVTTAADGEAALALLHQRPFDLVLLDLKMPGLSGIEVAQRARALQPEVALLILTGHGSLESALEGLHLGVVDYLLKTASPQAVVARVTAALAQHEEARRRQQLLERLQAVVSELGGTRPPAPPPEVAERWIEVGDVQISTWNQVVRRGGQTLNLTPTEFRILVCLAQQAGQVLTYQQIVECAQGFETSALEAAQLVKPHLYHLRQKLEPDPTNPRYILTVRGTGYLLATSAPEERG